MVSSMSRHLRWIGTLAVLAASIAHAGCSPDFVNTTAPGPTGLKLEAALVEQFGQVAEGVLNHPSLFTMTSTGDVFVSPTPRDWNKGLLVMVPVKADAPVRFQAPDGFTLEVWDDDQRGYAESTEQAVTFLREEGTAIWKAGNGFAKQWLYLPNGAAQREVASYRWKGGEARQHGRSIDVYDEAEKARITVSAPEALTTRGEHINVAMELRGERMWVVLEKPTGGPLLVDPVWVPAGDMAVPRMHHRSELLQDGRVLVVGGISDPVGNELASTELFDPMTDTWSSAGVMAVGRYYHTMTVLNDNRVLVVGGEWPPSISSEIYDPALNTWAATAPPNHYRIGHTATLLLDGRVLCAGGTTNAPNSAELFDPIADTWTPTFPMAKDRQGHLAARLPSGDVLTVGGAGDLSTEAYSPTTDTWSIRSSSNSGHPYTNAVVLSNGTVLLPGGSAQAVVEHYDFQQDIWTLLANTNVIRRGAPALLTSDDLVLVAGGDPDPFDGIADDSTELYDSAADNWTLSVDLLQARTLHTANLLKDDRILVGGGYDITTGMNSCEILLAKVLENGDTCTKHNQCASSHCVGGICCDSACGMPCFSCKLTEGAAQDGFCAASTGVACDDNDLCTEQDTCVVGVCVGTPIVCSGGDCTNPYCDAATGNCMSTDKVLGTPCGTGGICVNGDCIEPSGTGGAGGLGGAGGAGEGGKNVNTTTTAGSGGTGGRAGTGGAGEPASQTSVGAGGNGGEGGDSGGFMGPSASDDVHPSGGCTFGDSTAVIHGHWILLLAVSLLRPKRCGRL